MESFVQDAFAFDLASDPVGHAVRQQCQQSAQDYMFGDLATTQLQVVQTAFHLRLQKQHINLRPIQGVLAHAEKDQNLILTPFKATVMRFCYCRHLWAALLIFMPGHR